MAPAPVAVTADRTLLTQERRAFTSGSDPGVSRDSTLYFRHDPTGAFLDTIGRFPGAEFYVSIPREGMISVTSPAFGLSPQLAPHTTPMLSTSGPATPTRSATTRSTASWCASSVWTDRTSR